MQQPLNGLAVEQFSLISSGLQLVEQSMEMIRAYGDYDDDNADDDDDDDAYA